MVIPTNIKSYFKGPGGSTVALLKVTPKLAQTWLDKYNVLNRTLSAPRVKELAREMSDGEWMFAGDAIRFSGVIIAGSELPNGYTMETDSPVLLDGQHRLEAIVASGEAQQLVVITGLSLDTQDIIDTGRKRTVADMLKLHGYANHRSLAGALVALKAHLHYRATGSYGQFQELGHIEALELLAKYPEIVDSVEYARSVTRKDRYNDGAVASSIAVAHWEITTGVLGTSMVTKAQDFFESLKTGYEPYPTSAISAIRNSWADRVRSGSTGSVNRQTRMDQIGLILHGWEVYGPARGKKNITAKTLQSRVSKGAFPLP